MKLISRISVLVLSVFLLFTLLTCAIGAEAGTGFREINGAVGESLYEDYRKQILWYDNKESVGWSEAALDQIIQDVMHPYFARISLLSVKDDASYEEEMRLLHAQGTAAGRLTWIYCINEELHSFPAVTNQYQALMDEIDPAVNHDGDPANDREISIDFFTPQDSSLRTVENCYDEMIATVYRQQIQTLENRAGLYPDSNAVKGIISNALLHELPTLRFYEDFYPYFDESDEERYPQYQLQTNPYQELYLQTAELIGIQKNREVITRQLAEVFSKLYPLDPFPTTSNDKISAFHTAMATKRTVSEMNGQLQTTLLLLLKDLANTGTDTYRTEYLLGSAEKEGLAQRIVAATASSNTLAQITPLFESYESDLRRADRKDELTSYVSEIKSTHPSYTAAQNAELDSIANSYTRDGGIFDTASEHNLTLELTRAKRRLDLLVAYRDALSKASWHLDGSPTNNRDLQELSDELLEEYEATDTLILSSGAISDPSTLFVEALSLFADTVAEAEARAFENAHAFILSITPRQIQSADASLLITYKALLNAALTDACGGTGDALSDAAIAKLESRKSESRDPSPVLSAIGKSYLEVVRAQIALTLTGNSGESERILALRENISAHQQERILSLSFSIDPQRGLSELIALPTAANPLLERATEADSLLDHYCYEIENDVKNSSMESYCELATQRILGGTLSISDAILHLSRMEAEAKIRKVAEGHASLSEVEEILERLSADLNGCPDEASITSYVENALFLIDARITAHHMLQKIQSALNRISELQFLTEEQRSPYESAANALRVHPSLLQNATRKDTDLSSVKEAVSQFNHALSLLEKAISYTRDAHEQYLTALKFIEEAAHPQPTLKEQWTNQGTEWYTHFLGTTLEQLTQAEEAHTLLIKNLLDLIKTVARTELEWVTLLLTEEIGGYRYLTEEEIATNTSALTGMREEAIGMTAGSATITDVSEQCTAGKEKLRAFALTVSTLEKESCCRILTERLQNSYTPDHYSSEIQKKLEETILRYKNKISAEKAVEENEAIVKEALELIAKEINLLQEAQEKSMAKLNDAYQKLLGRSGCYSEKNLSLLRETYETALSAIRAPRNVSDWQQVALLVEDAILGMQEICLDRIYTADKRLEKEIVTTSPDEYAPANDGYVAMVESQNGIPSDSILSVLEAKDNDISKKLRNAVKKNLIFPADGSAAGENLLGLLKDAKVCAAWQITLDTAMLNSAERYTVSLLLPRHLREESLIGVVFVREDGSVEFYDAFQEGDLLSFEVSHFSDFYLLCEGSVNLMPWIIVLSILIICEVLTLILLYRRKNGTDFAAEVSLPLFGFSPLLLKIYRPANGVGILWLLGGISLSLAAWIAWLIASEFRSKYPETEYPEEEEEEDDESDPVESENLLPESDPIPVLISGPKRLLLSDSGPLAQVTVAEANALMSDEIAKEELAVESADFEEYEIPTGRKKAELNIDVIAKHFESGDVVTLSALKEKKLISGQTGHVKILARGTLDKPLTIIAQDFSLAALKMILLTGGTPIVAKSSTRKNKKQ